jgi:hypothetical protein
VLPYITPNNILPLGLFSTELDYLCSDLQATMLAPAPMPLRCGARKIDITIISIRKHAS